MDFSKARGIDVRMVPATAAYMDCTSGQGAMMAISATSKNPDKALQFLNLLNTDPVVMTYVNYGVEGFTYNKNDDGTITFIDDARATYSPWTNGVGNVRILPPTSDQGADFWQRFSAYYDAAETLPSRRLHLRLLCLRDGSSRSGQRLGRVRLQPHERCSQPRRRPARVPF